MLRKIVGVFGIQFHPFVKIKWDFLIATISYVYAFNIFLCGVYLSRIISLPIIVFTVLVYQLHICLYQFIGHRYLAFLSFSRGYHSMVLDIYQIVSEEVLYHWLPNVLGLSHIITSFYFAYNHISLIDTFFDNKDKDKFIRIFWFCVHGFCRLVYLQITFQSAILAHFFWNNILVEYLWPLAFRCVFRPLNNIMISLEILQPILGNSTTKRLLS